MVETGNLMETITASQFRALKPKKKSKYRNRKVVHEGMTFDSNKEYRRWIELNILEKAGHITDLKRQVSFDLGVCRYKADFTYMVFVGQNGVLIKEVVEDVKGFKTQVYKLKKKLMEQVYGIEIKET